MHELTIKNLTTGYFNKPVLHNINLTCQPGRLTFIIGPNGCGKTTLLKSVAQLLPYQGQITYDSQDLSLCQDKQRAKIMAIFSQITTVNLNFSIIDTVVTGRYPHLESNFSDYSADDYRIAQEVLEKVGLAEKKDQLLSHCSGGQLQRVLIARLVVQDPHIILIDEITNHLDFKYQIEVLDFIRQWAIEHKKIVLGVLHDVNLVTGYADEVVLLKHGKIMVQGAPSQTLTQDNLKNLYDIDVLQWYHDVYTKWFKED